MCFVAFLFLIDYAVRLPCPVSLVRRVGEYGLAVMESLYPERSVEKGEPRRQQPCYHSYFLAIADTPVERHLDKVPVTAVEIFDFDSIADCIDSRGPLSEVLLIVSLGRKNAAVSKVIEAFQVDHEELSWKISVGRFL